MIRNIIFDWSGTLMDDLPAVFEATNHVFSLAGVPPMTLDRFRAEFQLPFDRFYRRFVPSDHLTKIEPWFHEKFTASQDLVTEIPHARAFLEFCRRHGIRTFLLSTLHRRHFESQATRNGFDALLDKSYVEVPDKREKIHAILSENGLLADETIFVGDMQHDIETARHGGIHSCAVLTGYNNLAQLRASRPDLIVEHLGELQDLLTARKFNLSSASTAEHPIPISTVGALIFNPDGRLLMIRTHKWSDLWGIPGGKIKYGESSLDALRREVEEETALQIEEIRFVTVQDCIESTEFYRPSHFLLLNYTARAKAPIAVKLNEEAREFAWVTPAEAARLPLNRPTRNLLEIVFPTPSRQTGVIKIDDMAVSYRVGVPIEERSRPQKLLVSVEMQLDVGRAAAGDLIEATVNYQNVYDQIRALGSGRSWKLIETVASNIADLLLSEYPIESAAVEVKKFILPETRHVSVRIEKRRDSPVG